MQETFGVAQAVATAFFTSPIGAAELIVGLLVGAGFLAFAVNGRDRSAGETFDDRSYPTWSHRA